MQEAAYALTPNEGSPKNSPSNAGRARLVTRVFRLAVVRYLAHATFLSLLASFLTYQAVRSPERTLMVLASTIGLALLGAVVSWCSDRAYILSIVLVVDWQLLFCLFPVMLDDHALVVYFAVMLVGALAFELDRCFYLVCAVLSWFWPGWVRLAFPIHGILRILVGRYCVRRSIASRLSLVHAALVPFAFPSGPLLWCLMIGNPLRYMRAEWAPLSNAQRSWSYGLWNASEPSPDFRHLCLARREDPRAQTPFKLWAYNLAFTPKIQTLRFITNITVPRWFEPDLPESDEALLTCGCCYLEKQGEDMIVEDLTGHLFAAHRDKYSMMIVWRQAASGSLVLESIDYKGSVYTEASSTWPQMRRLLYTSRYLLDWATYHTLTHMWFEDYVRVAEDVLPPDDPLLCYFQDLNKYSGYHGSANPVAFDSALYEAGHIGAYFQLETSFLAEFRLEDCSFDADIVRGIRTKGQDCIPGCQYARTMLLYQEVLSSAMQTFIEKSSVEERRYAEWMARVNQLHKTDFTRLHAMLTNHLLFLVAHSMAHEVAAGRRNSTVEESFRLMMSTKTFETTLQDTFASVMGEEVLGHAMEADFPPHKVNYGIQV